MLEMGNFVIKNLRPSWRSELPSIVLTNDPLNDVQNKASVKQTDVYGNVGD
jgi:hypothetical protein